MSGGTTSDPGRDDLPAAALPERPSVDGELVHARVMASLFGRRVAPPRFGRFELRERIGEGGMGVVYRAWDPQLERAVAIKLIDTAAYPEAQRERALREARSLARLAHPSVITVFEAGLAGDQVWIAMEYVPGTTLRDYLTRTPPPTSAAILRHWLAVGRGLVAVHAAGLVHRDVKPSNVLIGDDDRARLIDFGLVRLPDADPDALTTATSSGDGSPSAARTVGFVGTRAYAAPEQLRGAEVDAAADQYAFCVSLWESLCGERPPTGAGPLPAPPQLPARLQRALARGLADDPRARFASLAELLAELEAVVAPSRRLGRIAAAAGLGAVLAGLGVHQLRAPVSPPSPCAVDETALAGTRDEPRRQALRARFTADDLDFAAPTLATFERGLDSWAARWQAARQAACTATRIAGVQSEAALDLRNACLERKRRAVAVTLDTILSEKPGSHAAAGAPELLAGLPDLDDCDDPERLAQIDPLPADASERAAIERGYDVLTQARALATAGALAEAEALVPSSAAEADAHAYAPLRLELAALPARLELLRERTAQGVPQLVALAREAGGLRLDELAATLLVDAAEAAAGHWSKPELEAWLVDEADAALRRLGRPHDPRTVALALARGRLLAQSGRLAEALAAHHDTAARARELGDDAHADALHLNIAAVQADLGRHDDARDTLAAGRDAAQRRWGAGAPRVGQFEFDLALLALDTGEFTAAQAHLDRAESIARAAFGADALTTAQIWFARAKLDMVAGDFAAAIERVDAALPIHVRELGLDHEVVADLHEARGVLRFFTGDFAGSLAAYDEALRVRSRVLGPEHPLLARLHSNLGESYLALGRLAEATQQFDAALASLARSLPADHPDVALPLKGRGQVALAEGRGEAAAGDLERALAIQLAAGAEPLEIADLRFSLARALALAGGRSRSPAGAPRRARGSWRSRPAVTMRPATCTSRSRRSICG